jgi:hypothetical protein
MVDFVVRRDHNKDMNTTTYPTTEEVNELLEQAETVFGGFASAWDGHKEFRTLLTSARNCKGEAIAYEALRKAVAK